MYTEEEVRRIVSHVCGQLSEKRPLYKVLAEDAGMPSSAVWYDWEDRHPWIAEKVARARERGMTAHLDDIVLIADGKDAQPSFDPQIRKVRIYAREKAAQMLAPRKFGAKLDLTSAGEKLEAPKTTVMVDNRVQSLIAIAQQRKLAAPPAALDDMMEE